MGEDKVAADQTGLFTIMQNDDGEIENPTNFLQRFSSEKTQIPVSHEFSQQPDLSLGLSLGGLYGENKNNKNTKPLARSFSVGGVTGGHAATGVPKTLPPATTACLSISRSCSLPAEPEKRMIEELKDFQAMKKMVAKKRRRVSFEDEKSQPEVTLAVPASALTSTETAASATKSPVLSRAIFKIESQVEGIKIYLFNYFIFFYYYF